MKKLKNICLLLLIAVVAISCEKEVSVSPPDEPPPNGYLFIESIPQGSQIFMEGRDRRRETPDSITWLETGVYNFALKKEYFMDTTFTIDVVEGERRTVLIDYTKNPRFFGRIECVSNPPGCDIYLNGENTGQITPSVLNGIIPGLYEVTYKKEGYEDKTLSVGVWSNQLTENTTTLIDTTVWSYFNTDNSEITTNSLTCVEANKNGEVWMGSTGNGIITFNGRAFNNYTISNSGLGNNHVTDIAFDSNNNFWASTFGGATFQWQSFSQKTSPLPQEIVSSIDVRSDNSIFDGEAWMTTPVGVYFAFNDPQFGLGWNFITPETGFPQANPTEIRIDNLGRKWVATEKSGVVRVITSNEIYHYTAANSTLPSNIVTAISASGSQVWVACATFSGNRGGTLARFVNDDWDSFVFSLDETMGPNNELFIDSKGYLWVTSNLGIYVVKGFSETEILNEETTGMDLTEVVEITEDINGDIWMATSGSGLIRYKRD